MQMHRPAGPQGQLSACMLSSWAVPARQASSWAWARRNSLVQPLMPGPTGGAIVRAWWTTRRRRGWTCAPSCSSTTSEVCFAIASLDQGLQLLALPVHNVDPSRGAVKLADAAAVTSCITLLFPCHCLQGAVQRGAHEPGGAGRGAARHAAAGGPAGGCPCSGCWYRGAYMNDAATLLREQGVVGTCDTCPTSLAAFFMPLVLPLPPSSGWRSCFRGCREGAAPGRSTAAPASLTRGAACTCCPLCATSTASPPPSSCPAWMGSTGGCGWSGGAISPLAWHALHAPLGCACVRTTCRHVQRLKRRQLCATCDFNGLLAHAASAWYHDSGRALHFPALPVAGRRRTST